MYIENERYEFRFMSNKIGLLDLTVEICGREQRFTATVFVSTFLDMMASSDWELLPYKIANKGGSQVVLKCDESKVILNADTSVVLDLLNQSDEFSINDMELE